MSRTVALESNGFVVSDDPQGVVGRALALLVGGLDELELALLIGPSGDGYSIDTIGAVFRLDDRDDLPEPWDQDPTLDPATTELWELMRFGRGGTKRFVIPGDELRDLVAQARALRPLPHRTVTSDSRRFLTDHDRTGVIGHTITLIVKHHDLAQIDHALAPDGPGCAVDGLGSVTRIRTRADLPAPWDQATAIDPAKTELWALRRDPTYDTFASHNTFVIAGEELRDLVAQALALGRRHS